MNLFPFFLLVLCLAAAPADTRRQGRRNDKLLSYFNSGSNRRSDDEGIKRKKYRFANSPITYIKLPPVPYSFVPSANSFMPQQQQQQHPLASLFGAAASRIFAPAQQQQQHYASKKADIVEEDR